MCCPQERIRREKRRIQNPRSSRKNISYDHVAPAMHYNFENIFGIVMTWNKSLSLSQEPLSTKTLWKDARVDLDQGWRFSPQQSSPVGGE